MFTGREFRAVFIGTSDVTSMEGIPLNPTKTMFDPYIFNTTVTRSKSLVVAVGNPYLILHIEKKMEATFGNRAKCWSQFMKQCLECNTFNFSNEAKKSISNKEEYDACRTHLYNKLFGNFKTRIELDNNEKQGDSILKAYQEEVERIFEYRKAKLILARATKTELSWIMNNEGVEPVTLAAEETEDEEEESYLEKYDCVLNFHSYREAEAIPLEPEKKVVTIRGAGNRIGAFDGDTFEVGVFCDNPEGKCYGRALKLKARGGEATFVCRVSSRNPVVFYPIDKKNPKFYNLPRISRDLLQKRDKDAVQAELRSTDVVVFDHQAVESDTEELKIPQIRQVIPHSVASNMLFIVAFLRWKKPYRVPLGIVIGALPKGYTALSAERLLKMKHGIVYNEDETTLQPSVDARQGLDCGPLYDRAFTIDPDDAQNLDDAVSLLKLQQPSTGSHNESSTETFQIGVHIVNCAKHIEPNEHIDKEAKRRGVSVYGGREGKIMQMLPVKMREKLSLQPNKIRNVLSVTAVITFESDCILISEIKIKQAQIKSCIQLSYKKAQAIMDGICVPDLRHLIDQFNRLEGQPSLSMTLQLLYKIALNMRRERLKSDAAYCYDLNESEDLYCWKTHMLIEELMIWANSTVAKKIHMVFPDAALLRRQPVPNLETTKQFLDQHKQEAFMSLAFSSLAEQPENSDDLKFVMTTTSLSQISKAITSKNILYLTGLLFSDRYFPQLAAVHSQLHLNLHRAEYCCTDKGASNTSYQHYSLKLDHYTHFSSPLRRYIDIQVQRMLMELPEVSNVSGPPKEFLNSEHKLLCSQLNKRTRNAKQFQQSIASLELAVKFSSSSEVYEAFITDNTRGSIELFFPQLDLQGIPLRERRIQLKIVVPYASVDVEEHILSTLTRASSDQIFRWKIKMTSFNAEQGAFIFNVPGIQIHNNIISRSKSEEDGILIEIFTTSVADSDIVCAPLTVISYAATSPPATIKMPFSHWKKAMDFVKEPTLGKMMDLEKILLSPPIVSPVKEKIDLNESKTSPFVNYHYHRCFRPHDVIRVWMTRSMREALIAPTVQIVEVNPLVRICVQHNSHPAECFSDQNLSKASKKFYSSIDEYVHLWEKVLLAEAAEKSVKECRQVIIHDVKLEWPPLVIPSNCIDEEYYQPNGSVALILPENYVKNCSEFITFNEGDLVCVRYGTDPHANIRAVFHMVVHKISYNNNDETVPVKVMMRFIGDNCRISEVMKSTLSTKCELQLISLSTSYQ